MSELIWLNWYRQSFFFKTLPKVNLPVSHSFSVMACNDQSYSDMQCSHTENAANYWWQVDLETVHIVTAVYILNRQDCCSERLKDFYVLIDDKV